MGAENQNQVYGRWLDELTGRRRFGTGDRIGTANLIDPSARRRAAESIRDGTCTSLVRPLHSGPSAPGIRVDVTYVQVESVGTRGEFAKPLDAGSDTTCIAAHGVDYTHMDALNHMGRAGLWYGDHPVESSESPSVADLAEHKLFTRGVLVDIPAARGCEWVADDAPVTGSDIDAALLRQGADFVPGDALLLYMGRDRFEAAGGSMDMAATSMGAAQPGAGADAARWIAEHDVSILAWDLQDAFPPGDAEPLFPVHLLLPAIGLVLIDNCDLGPAAAQVRSLGRSTGALVVATPAVQGATGALVQPLFIQ
jgi:kynurenine formamidase